MANTTADKLKKLSSTKASLKSAINGTGATVGDVFSAYPDAIFKAKEDIAAAITEKGVATAPYYTFDTLVANIKAIKTGGESVTIKIGQSDPDTYIIYTAGDGSAKSISSPSKDQAFEALKGSACAIIMIKSSGGIGGFYGASSVDFKVSEIFYNSYPGYKEEVEIFVYMATLSNNGTINLIPN